MFAIEGGKMQKKIFFLAIILLNLLCLPLVFSETIVLKSGKTIEAKIVNRTAEYITVIDQAGYITKYRRDEIKNIVEDSVVPEVKKEGRPAGNSVSDSAGEKKETKQDNYNITEENLKKELKRAEEIIKKALENFQKGTGQNNPSPDNKQ